MKKLLLPLVLFAILISISCKEDKSTDETVDECTDCCDGGCELEPGYLFEQLVTGSPSSVKLGDDIRDEWATMDITVTYDGESGAAIEVEGVPEGGEGIWYSGSITFNSDWSEFQLNNDGINRSVDISEHKVVITFRYDNSTRLASFDGEWEFIWE